MALVNPVGRVNYEPNSWAPELGGPREDPERGFQSFPEEDGGPKRRLRAESFADHYSQARQFYVSQQPIEQKHIQDAFVFELSKCERLDIRERMVANLGNVDGDLADLVAAGLGLATTPDPSEPASPPITRPRAVTGAQHRGERPAVFGRTQGRCARHRWRRR